MKSEWKKCTIGDCLQIVKTSVIPKAGTTYSCFSLPAFDNSKTPEILDGKDIKSSKFALTENTILFNKLNPKFRRIWNIHSLAQIRNPISSTEFLPLKVNGDVCQDFLYYYICSPNFTALMDGIKTGTSSSQQRIDWRLFLRQPIYLPPLPIQRSISRILKDLDTKIQLNQQINDNLQQQVTALFESWFVDYDPWGGIQPSEWTNAPLGSFVEIKRGGSPRPIQDYLSDSGLRWLKISDVTSLNSPFVLEIKEHIKEEGLKKTVFLHAGELILSNSATPGIPKILDVDTCIHDGWLYFPKSELSKYYLYLFFKHIRKELVSLGNGSVFTNLKTDILKAFPATKADKVTLKKFDALVSPLFDAMLNADRENLKLATMRDSLLPQLMSGKIDVSTVQL